jgi:predicted outer membrane repeat protein
MVMRRRVSVRAWVILGALALAFLGTASAHASNTLTVCPAGPPECQFETVQEALDAAQTGDRILIAPGTYAAGFTVAKNVSLIGSGESETTLSGGEVAVTIAADVTVEVTGLTISQGRDTGLVNRGRLTLTDSTVARNGFASQPGPAGGIYNAGILTLLRSTIGGNITPDFGSVGGMRNDGQLTMRDSAIVNNYGETGALLNEGSAAITGTAFRSNDGMGVANIRNGGHLVLRDGLVAEGGSDITGALDNSGVALIVDTVLRDNSGVDLTIVNRGRASLTINRSIIRGNDSSEVGGAITNLGVLRLRGSRVTGNRAMLGGGIYNTGTAELSHSVITGNTAFANGGGIYNTGTAELSHSVVTGNTAGESGGGIYNTGPLTLRHTLVRQNNPDDCVGCSPLLSASPAPRGSVLQPSLAFTLRPVPAAG